MTGTAGKSLEGCRVLVLEDEFYIADDLARGLRQNGAEPLGPVSTVSQAERIIAEEKVDAAILDLNLRGEIAADFVKRLAAQRMPCLIVSGYGGDAVPQAVSHLPRLEKPVGVSTVLKRLALELTPRTKAEPKHNRWSDANVSRKKRSMSFTLADLDMADRHVARAERHVLDQEELLSGLRLKGADTTLAEELLVEFNRSLRIHRVDRDHIAASLGQSA